MRRKVTVVAHLTDKLLAAFAQRAVVPAFGRGRQAVASVFVLSLFWEYCFAKFFQAHLVVPSLMLVGFVAPSCGFAGHLFAAWLRRSWMTVVP